MKFVEGLDCRRETVGLCIVWIRVEELAPQKSFLPYSSKPCKVLDKNGSFHVISTSGPHLTLSDLS